MFYCLHSLDDLVLQQVHFFEKNKKIGATYLRGKRRQKHSLKLDVAKHIHMHKIVCKKEPVFLTKEKIHTTCAYKIVNIFGYSILSLIS